MTSSIDEKLSLLASNEDVPLAFELELQDVKKPIKAYLWRSKESVKLDNIHLCIYTHGAGGTCLSSGSANLCQGLVDCRDSDTKGSLVVLAFDGAMHLGSRTKAFVALAHWATDSSKVATISLAGRSMGCRAAAITAKECLQMPKFSQKLVLQSYPLLGAGKGTKDAERKQVLLDLPPTVSILFQTGTADEMGPVKDLRDVQGAMAASTTTVTIANGDHGLQLAAGIAPRGTKSELEENIGRTAGRVAREWLLSNNCAKLGDGEISIQTEEANGNVIWSSFAEAVTNSKVQDEGRKTQKRSPPAEEKSPKAPSRRSKRTKR